MIREFQNPDAVPSARCRCICFVRPRSKIVCLPFLFFCCLVLMFIMRSILTAFSDFACLWKAHTRSPTALVPCCCEIKSVSFSSFAAAAAAAAVARRSAKSGSFFNSTSSRKGLLRPVASSCTLLVSDAHQVDSPKFLLRACGAYESSSFAVALVQSRMPLNVSLRCRFARETTSRAFDNLACARPLSSDGRRTGGRMAEDSRVPPSVSATENSNQAAGVAAAGEGEGDSRRQDGVWFRVSDSVKLVLHRGDITTWFVDGESDAIVNAANSRMLGGGGVDGAIHRKAGPKLKEACKQIPEVSRGVRCPIGEARVTKGFDLPVSRVIHTVGPIYFEHRNPADLLSNAYRNSLKAAIEEGIKYIAFPAISCGVYGYPYDEGATVSLSAIREASDGLSEVHFVLFDQETYFAWLEEAEQHQPFTKI